MRQNLLGTAIVCLGLWVFPFGPGQDARAQDKDDAAQADAPLPAVTVAAAAFKDLRQSTLYNGRVVSLQNVSLRARVTGFVEAIPFTEGQPVKTGDLLYQIEDEDYSASVAEAEGAVSAAEAELRLAQIEVDRKTTLVARDAVAQSELDIATAKHDEVAGRLISLRADVDKAKLMLSYTQIHAPFDGVIGLSVPDLGALVTPESGPLVTLTALDPISVEFPVAMAIYLNYQKKLASGEIDQGPNVSLILPNGDDFDQKGTIDFVSSVVNQGTDTVIVRAIFKNPDAVLLDGALVSVVLEQSAPQKVLAIPQQAVQQDQQGAFVLVVGQDGTVEKRSIVVARNTAGQAVVSKGLKENENVITEGISKVRPGAKVDASSDSGA